MKWPWVARQTLDAAEERTRWAETALRAAEEKAAIARAQSDELRALLTETKASAEREHRLLMDRIFVLSGQRPMYETPSAPAAQGASPDLQDLAKRDLLPQAGVTFRGVHQAARQAMADGTFDIDKARVRVR